MLKQHVKRQYFAQSIKPILKTSYNENLAIVGFDTEYHYQTSQLISVQLTYGDKELFIDATKEKITKITPQMIREWGYKLGISYRQSIFLVCFNSIAELQHCAWGWGKNEFRLHTLANTFYACGEDNHKKSIVVYDLMSLFGRNWSLAKLAQEYGLKKIDYPRAQITEADLKNPKFKEYAINDARICEKIFPRVRQLIWDKFQVDVTKTKTAAATGAWIYRRHYVPEVIENRNTACRRVALWSLWGGINLACRRGVITGDIKYYDAVSCYPHSVIDLGVLPTGKDFKEAKSLDEFLSGRGGFGIVRFVFPYHVRWPCLPVWKASEREDGFGQLVWPRSGISYASLDEIRLAHELGAKLFLRRGFYYTDGDPGFCDFQKELMKYRLQAKAEGRDCDSKMWKLISVAVIGKLAQRRRAGIPIELYQKLINDYPEIPPADLLNFLGIDYIRYLARQWNDVISTGSCYYPEWNVLILGHARANMWRIVNQSDMEPLYIATDGIVFKGSLKQTDSAIQFEHKGTGTKAIIVRSRLMSLQDEQGKYIHLAFHALHSDKAAKALFEDLGKSDNWLDYYNYERRHMVGFKEAIRKGEVDQFGKVVDESMMISLRWDGKRELLPDGSTIPLRRVRRADEFS